MTTIGKWSTAALPAILRARGSEADEMWREWAAGTINRSNLGIDELTVLWRTVLDFDPTLAGYVENPVEVDAPVVLVAGSGKETFKTFNVSTAASLLAAAAGAQVVKGVSRSVSAVSGSADVLDEMGVGMCTNPREIPDALEGHGIAFVPYAAFCPTYAARYDGVFTDLTPFSFFMPTAVLGVRACAFVHGIAHPDVLRAAAAIRAARPDLKRGIVVATSVTGGKMMDEAAPYSRSVRATIQSSRVTYAVRSGVEPTSEWTAAVRHRHDHQTNAQLIVSALAPEPLNPGRQHIVDLAETNASLIVGTSFGLTSEQARHRVRCARQAGEALALLDSLRARVAEVRRAS